MSVQFCLVLAALASLTAASDPGCEELLKSMQDPQQASGKWIYHVGTSDNEEFLMELKKTNSSWMENTFIPDSDKMILTWADRIDGKCYIGSVNATTSENTTTATFHFNGTTYVHTGKYLESCPDCIMWTDNSERMANGETRKGRNLYLFTKTGKLDDAHLDIFKKQAACLNFPDDFHFGETTGLCEKEAATKVDEQ